MVESETVYKPLLMAIKRKPILNSTQIYTMQTQNSDQQLTFLESVIDFPSDVETDSIKRSKSPNFQGLNHAIRQSMSCSCLVNLDQYINNLGDCSGREIQHNSSTRDVSGFFNKKYETIDDEDAVEVPRPRKAVLERKPTTESDKLIFDSPKKAKGENRVKKRLRILGRPFARLGEGMLHAMEHLVEAIPI